MEQLTRTAGTLCILIMAMGLLSKLGSFQSTEKVVRFVIALYIIAAFFKSFQNTALEIEIEYPPQIYYETENAEILKDRLLYTTQLELEQLVKKRLNEKNISYNDLSVHILEQNGNVAVDKISVNCSKEYEKEVMDCIQDIIGQETKIVIGE